MIKGFFRNGAGFINVHVVSESMNIDETIEFLVDTGASRIEDTSLILGNVQIDLPVLVGRHPTERIKCLKCIKIRR